MRKSWASCTVGACKTFFEYCSPCIKRFLQVRFIRVSSRQAALCTGCKEKSVCTKVATRRVSRCRGSGFATNPASTRHATLARRGFVGYLIESSSKQKHKTNPVQLSTVLYEIHDRDWALGRSVQSSCEKIAHQKFCSKNHAQQQHCTLFTSTSIDLCVAAR